MTGIAISTQSVFGANVSSGATFFLRQSTCVHGSEVSELVNHMVDGWASVSM